MSHDIWGLGYPSVHYIIIQERVPPNDLATFVKRSCEQLKVVADRITSRKDRVNHDLMVKCFTSQTLVQFNEDFFFSRLISEEWKTGVLTFSVVESFTWQCEVHLNGRYLDRHWSCPTITGVVGDTLEEQERDRKKSMEDWKGQPESFAEVLRCDPALVIPYLKQMSEEEIRAADSGEVDPRSLKGHPTDKFTLAGGWAFLDMLVHAGLGEVVQYILDPDHVLDNVLTLDLDFEKLVEVNGRLWTPPTLKPWITV